MKYLQEHNGELAFLGSAVHEREMKEPRTENRNRRISFTAAATVMSDLWQGRRADQGNPDEGKIEKHIFWWTILSNIEGENVAKWRKSALQGAGGRSML
jgi:hypothetical protein